MNFPSAFRLFLPPLKNPAEVEDLPSTQFPIFSLVLRLHVKQLNNQKTYWATNQTRLLASLLSRNRVKEPINKTCWKDGKDPSKGVPNIKIYIYRFLPKNFARHRWSWHFFLYNFQILGPLGCQGMGCYALKCTLLAKVDFVPPPPPPRI